MGFVLQARLFLSTKQQPAELLPFHGGLFLCFLGHPNIFRRKIRPADQWDGNRGAVHAN